MQFQVTYRLTHPEYLPTLSQTTLSAQTHQQLDEAITKLVRKWDAQGYTPAHPCGEKETPLQTNRCLSGDDASVVSRDNDMR